MLARASYAFNFRHHLCCRSVVDVHQNPVASTAGLRAITLARIIATRSQRVHSTRNRTCRRSGCCAIAFGVVLLSAINVSTRSASIHAIADSSVVRTTGCGKGHAVLQHPGRGAVHVACHEVPSLVALLREECLLIGVVNHNAEPITGAADLSGIARALHATIGCWSGGAGLGVAAPAF